MNTERRETTRVDAPPAEDRRGRCRYSAAADGRCPAAHDVLLCSKTPCPTEEE